MTIEDDAKLCHQIAIEHEFWPEERTPDVYVAKMMLLVSEVAEIMEAYRKEHGPVKLTEEFADTYIRLVDLWAGMADEGLVTSLDEAITTKINVNDGRPIKHGNLL